jgi:hypothetical protein
LRRLRRWNGEKLRIGALIKQGLDLFGREPATAVEVFVDEGLGGLQEALRVLSRDAARRYGVAEVVQVDHAIGLAVLFDDDVDFAVDDLLGCRVVIAPASVDQVNQPFRVGRDGIWPGTPGKHHAFVGQDEEANVLSFVRREIEAQDAAFNEPPPGPPCEVDG